MRILGGAVVLLLTGGSPLLALQEQDTDEIILALQKKIEELENAVNRLKPAEAQPQPAANLEDQLDDVLQNPSEPLLEPSRMNFSAPGLDRVTWSGGFRWRGTYWDRFKPAGSSNGDSVLTFDQRLDLGIGARLTEKTELFVELHDGRIWGNNPVGTPTSAQVDSFEIASAYLDMADVYGSGFDLRLGRQAVELGRERLIGDDEWLNTPIRFDGLSANSDLSDSMHLFVGAYRLQDEDDFGTEIGPGPTTKIGNTEAYITYLTNDIGDLGQVDVYVILFDNDASPTLGGQTQFFTYGARWANEMDQFWWDGEFATQFGEFANNHDNDYGFDRIGISVEAGVDITDGSDGLASGVYVGYDYATGGSNTFFTLAPQQHGWFGIMDFASWSNVIQYKIGGKVDLGDGVLDASWRWLGLENSNGVWGGYNDFGVGGGSDRLGQELDVIYTVPCGDSSEVNIAAAYFWPDDAYQNSHGSNHGTFYSYLMYGLTF